MNFYARARYSLEKFRKVVRGQSWHPVFDVFPELLNVGKVIGPARYHEDEYVVLVQFPHVLLNCWDSELQLHTKGEQKAITDGLPPKRLWSAIDHTGESPGPPESKKVQGRQDHGKVDGGHEAKSQDYGTRFVNGNKGVG